MKTLTNLRPASLESSTRAPALARHVAMFAVAVSAATLIACSGDAEDQTTTSTNGTEPEGQVTLNWTINGSTDPQTCDSTGSQSFYVAVHDANGGNSLFESTCATHATKISLPPGTYTASTFLLDGQNRPQTRTIELAKFTVETGGSSAQTVDFASGSFL